MSQRRHDSIMYWWDRAVLPEDKDWYLRTNGFIKTLSYESGETTANVAAMLAIASPMISWDQAMSAVHQYLLVGEDDRLTPLMSVNALKVMNLMQDGNIALHLRGWKVRSFYENLLHPTTSQRVTIDRWAMRVFGLDERKYNLSDARVYERFADSYRLAAADLGVLPLQVQAATWCAIRREEEE